MAVLAFKENPLGVMRHGTVTTDTEASFWQRSFQIRKKSTYARTQIFIGERMLDVRVVATTCKGLMSISCNTTYVRRFTFNVRSLNGSTRSRVVLPDIMLILLIRPPPLRDLLMDRRRGRY
jgi:hypothetical protein